MLREELNFLFEKYLDRIPYPRDVDLHLNKSYEIFEQEISTCAERRELVKSPRYILKNISNKKIAITLSGHIRRLQVLDSLKDICRDYNVDVFVHTWDNYGLKGSETNLHDLTDSESIKNTVEQIPSIKDYIIENNKKFITSLPKSDVKYFNYSSPEVFIKSQLYSIHQSYKLMEKYATKQKINYDMVIRARMDLHFSKFELDELIFEEIKNKIIFFPNKDCGHTHPDYGTSCQLCDTLYYDHKVKSVHLIDHTTIPCDIFACGSMESMKKYCDLYNHYDRMLKGFEKRNLESLTENDIPHTITDNVYKLPNEFHLLGIYLLNCSYPEKLLQHHLKDYMLVESNRIKVVHGR